MPERGGLCPYHYGKPCKEGYCMAWRTEFDYEPYLRLEVEIKKAVALTAIASMQAGV